MYRTALILGTIFACLAVILGAFGAHGLKQIAAPEQIQIFETGVRYQLYHAFALLFTGVIYRSFAFQQIRFATIFFVAGIILFSGSLYLMTALKIQGKIGLGGLGIITPVGGVFFILGWLLLLLGLLRKKEHKA